MSYRPKSAPKTKVILDSIIEVNGEKINLGKLIKVTISRCSVRKTNQQTFNCINTGKSFTDYKKASRHVAEYLVKSGKVILNN
jgi:hypothetical protein